MADPENNILDFEMTVKPICKIGQKAECCRFLVCGAGGFECAKHVPSLAYQINDRVFHGVMVAQGDNCEGVKP